MRSARARSALVTMTARPPFDTRQQSKTWNGSTIQRERVVVVERERLVVELGLRVQVRPATLRDGDRRPADPAWCRRRACDGARPARTSRSRRRSRRPLPSRARSRRPRRSTSRTPSGAGGFSGASEKTQATVWHSPAAMACAACWIIAQAVAPPRFMVAVQAEIAQPERLLELERSHALVVPGEAGVHEQAVEVAARRARRRRARGGWRRRRSRRRSCRRPCLAA